MSKFLKNMSIDGHGGSFQSFNKDYFLVNANTKVIIVGTITPPKGRLVNGGFYYMSEQNRMYDILDAYYKAVNKSSSFKLNKKAVNIKALIEELKDKGIAFIDVIDSCNNPKESYKDDDLEDIKLDYEAFKDIDENIVLIANSKNAYEGLLKIMEHNHLKNKALHIHGFMFYKQEEWNKAFININL